MKCAVLAVWVTGLVLLAPAVVGAAPTSSATITATPATVTFGSATTVSGVVTGNHAAGATVTLEQAPFPYTAAFTKVATTTANSAGHYSFTITPGISTRYRVRANAAPTATSSATTVPVRVKVTLGVSSLKPSAGAKVLFFGTIQPAFNGRSVLIQRKTATGLWSTVAHATLTATTSMTRSKYSKHLTASHSSTYRARFVPPNGAYLANTSGTRHLTIH
jgi:hypothetical protein